MIRRFLLPTLVMACLSVAVGAPALAAAGGTVVKRWSDGPMPVDQMALSDGTKKCVFGQVAPNFDWLGVSQWQDGHIEITVGRKDNWTGGGKVTLSVDGGVPYSAEATIVNAGSANGLAVPVPNEGA